MGSSPMCPYLSGLARRPVKKQSSPRASMKRRKLRMAVRTTFRVDTRKAISGGESPHKGPQCPAHTATGLGRWFQSSGQWHRPGLILRLILVISCGGVTRGVTCGLPSPTPALFRGGPV